MKIIFEYANNGVPCGIAEDPTRWPFMFRAFVNTPTDPNAKGFRTEDEALEHLANLPAS